jgi:predicted CopG family antitoxin
MSTTICVDLQTKEKLSSLKKYPKESFNSVLERLTRMAIDEDELSDEAIQNIEEALEDIKMGRTYSEYEVKKELGLL